MKHVSIDLQNPYCTWHTVQFESAEGPSVFRVWVRGQAWDKGTFATAKSLAALVSNELAELSLPIETAFEDILCRLNGNFALVVQTPDRVLAAVDRIRSIPLFYGSNGTTFLLSDDPARVRHFTGDTEFDTLASHEYMLTGYVTGSDTLSPSVRQIQAGEFISTSDTGCNEVKAVRYYRFVHGNYYRESEKELFKRIERTLYPVFERLLDSVAGRRIVVPLSGGLDSRLIVTMLKLLDAKNVLCFTYGPPGNWECAISKKVSKRLGYEWAYISYTRKRWRTWFRTEERQTYSSYGGTLVSVPPLQDWAAVWELKKAKVLQNGDVFVPGHGGILAGGHIPKHWSTASNVDKHTTIQAILNMHYSLWNWLPSPDERIALLAERVADRLEAGEIDNPTQAASAFEKWEWQERQAKFITNNVRTYEFWGYDWRLPLWDNEFAGFWERVPLVVRIGKAFLRTYLDTQLFQKFGIDGLCQIAGYGGGSSTASQGRSRYTSFKDRQRQRWAKISSPYMGRHSLDEQVRTWLAYNQVFGNGWSRASIRHLLSTNTIRPYLFLQSQF